MIKDETVVSVVHLEQSCAREFVAIAVFYETTANETQTTTRIGEAHDLLLRAERFHPYPQSLCTGKCGLQLKHSYLFGVRAS